MSEPSDELRAVVNELRITVGILVGAVKSLEQTVNNAVTKDRVDAMQKELDAVVSFKDWAIKIVLALVITAVVGLVITQNGGGL